MSIYENIRFDGIHGPGGTGTNSSSSSTEQQTLPIKAETQTGLEYLDEATRNAILEAQNNAVEDSPAAEG